MCLSCVLSVPFPSAVFCTPWWPRITNISMEVGTEAGGQHPTGEAAALIEQCVCPPGTAGLSCQVGDPRGLCLGVRLTPACPQQLCVRNSMCRPLRHLPFLSQSKIVQNFGWISLLHVYRSGWLLPHGAGGAAARCRTPSALLS